MPESPGSPSFGDRVASAVAGTGPLCAGIDPSAELLAAWNLTDDARGVLDFGMRCVEAFAGVVPVVKPQVAFFERASAYSAVAAISAATSLRSTTLNPSFSPK